MPSLVDDPSIPSVGQQIAVEGYTIAIAARCQCVDVGALVPLAVTCYAGGTVSTPTPCPKCHLAYSIQGMRLDGQGRLTFAVAVLSPTPPTDS